MNTKMNADANKVILALGRGINNANEPTPDTRKVGETAAMLFKQGVDEGKTQLLVVSGRYSSFIRNYENNASVRREAEHMYSIAKQNGIPDKNILIEDKSKSTIENLRLSNGMIRQAVSAGYDLIIVCSRTMARRVEFLAQKIINTSGRIEIVPVEPTRHEDFTDKLVEFVNMVGLKIVVGGVQSWHENELDNQLRKASSLAKTARRAGRFLVKSNDAYSVKK